MAANRKGTYLGTGAVFLFGLPISVTLVATALWAIGIGRGTGSLAPTTLEGALGWYAVIIVFVGWPAILVASLLLPWLSTRLERRFAWLGASAGICAVLTLAAAIVIGGGGDLTEMLALSWVFLLFGGGAGLVCAMISERIRPRREEPLP